MRVNENFTVSNTAFLSRCTSIKAKKRPSLEKASFDTFEKSAKTFNFADFERKKDKLQISEYLMLNSDDKSLIRKKIPDEINEAADLSIDIAIKLKRKLDEAYGKNGYVFVSIGTSPAMIAKAIECMGAETKYLPISKLNTTKTTSKDILKQFDFKKYFDFLRKQGMGPAASVFNPKKFIFYDYTSTSKKTTLTKFKDIMLNEYHFPKFKCTFRSLNEDIMQLDMNERDMFLFIDEYLMNSHAEYYSSIGHLSYYDVPDTEFLPKNLTRHDNRDVKLFNFCIMDKLNDYNRLSENPLNASAL